jgi:hypothetical protein
MLLNEDFLFGCLYGKTHSVLEAIKEFNIPRENFYDILAHRDGFMLMLTPTELAEIHDNYCSQYIENGGCE